MPDSVIVGIRVRPLNSRESVGAQNLGHSWMVLDNSISRTEPAGEGGNGNGEMYYFDSIFKPNATNEEVYCSIAAPIVDNVIGGFNGTVFAYGQTSSGKTHSMLGTLESPGIIPLAIRQVLNAAGHAKIRKHVVKVSYMEVYNDIVRDLQNPDRGSLAVREDQYGRVLVDAEKRIVNSIEDAMVLLKKGQTARTSAETKMNSNSSRGHTIFTLHIEIKGRDGKDQNGRVSSLSLVDLAGSERLNFTQAEGTRLKEGTHINKSLLVLGRIINRLSNASGNMEKLGHLPYRDSNLTRLLRPALGGNAKTAVLCTVTPSSLHVQETISTLKFAERAKKVTNNARKNELLDYRSKYKEAATELKLLREIITSIKTELEALRHQKRFTRNNVMASDNTSLPEPQKRVTNENVLNFRKPVLEGCHGNHHSAEIKSTLKEIKYLRERLDIVDEENKNLRDQLKGKTFGLPELKSERLELHSSAKKSNENKKYEGNDIVLSFRKWWRIRNRPLFQEKMGNTCKSLVGGVPGERNLCQI